MDLETVVLRFCNFSFGKFKFMYPKCIRGVALLLVYFVGYVILVGKRESWVKQ